jgi:hypothetical protein
VDRPFNVSGIGKLPPGSSPADFSGYESPDINDQADIAYSTSFVPGVTTNTRYVYLATTSQPLTQTLIDQGQYPHISGRPSTGTNPEIVYIQNGIDVTHWPGADPSKWVALGLWADIVGTGSTATIVYECRVNDLSQICTAKPLPVVILAITSGDQQNGLIAATLPNPIVVAVTDSQGRPLPAVGISFSISQRPTGATGATVSPVASTTGPDGTASAQFTLGDTLGQYQVTASCTTQNCNPTSTVFTETAQPATGAINVTTNLLTATFVITGPATFSGNGLSFSLPSAPTGQYTITFGDVAGYNTPLPQTQTLTPAGSITFDGAYMSSAVLGICNQGACDFPSVLTQFTVSPSRFDHSGSPANCKAITSQPSSLDLTVGCFDSQTHQVLPNCNVQLALKSTPFAGGHDHDDPNRPVGNFTGLSPSTLITGSTGLAGFDFTVISPEVSGEVTLQASGTLTNGGAISASATAIVVKVSGLASFASSPTDYRLVGSKPAHSENHFGTPFMNTALISIAKEYAAEFPGYIVSYNDMSLVEGGVFDLNGNWTPPHCGHSSMGGGTNNVDLDLVDSSGTALIPRASWARLEQIIIQNGGLVCVRHSNHWHLCF